MARHVVKRSPAAREHEDLVELLADEIARGQNAQPACIEEEYAVTHSRHIYVVWDRWSNLPDDERTDVIVRAYAKAEGEEVAENIAVAIGVTGDEAVNMGLLPYVVSTPPNAREEFPPQVQAALRQERENTILGPQAVELRYPTFPDASKAVARLKNAVPHQEWAIIREVSRP